MSSNLDKVLSEINKTYDKGTIGVLGEMENQEIERFNSGSFLLDKALGGGYPKGRIIEIIGPESSGKTTIATHAIAEIQKIGGRAAIVDMEHAFDKYYASNLGVDTDSLIFTQPDNGEQAWEIIKKLAGSGEVDLIVMDSIAAMVPKRELEGEMGDAVVGLMAKMMGQGLRTSVASLKRNNCTLICINQLRDNVGVIYGPKEITPGGKAMKFYASVRLDVRRSSQVKTGDEVIANKTKVKTIKNKVYPPHKVAEFEIAYGEGIDVVGELLDASIEYGIIEQKGPWLYYIDKDGEKSQLERGKQKAKEFLNDNEELMEELRNRIQGAIDSTN